MEKKIKNLLRKIYLFFAELKKILDVKYTPTVY